ncbi:hypothetical protein [Methanobrevibacter sp.]|uniref:hypothetical protein n=1 Tax=Methanobrevibacter sp. TaxID=66852 RepID=UPI00388D8C93
MRFNYKILGLVMFVMLICCVSAASAADVDNITVPDDTSVIEIDDAVDSVEDVESDDANVDDTSKNVINQGNLRSVATINGNTNIGYYFDSTTGALKSNVGNTLTFGGDFYNADYNYKNFIINRGVTINANGATFNDMGFELSNSAITLNGATFIMNAPEDDDCILINVNNAANSVISNNVITYNCSYANAENYNHVIRVVESDSVEVSGNTIKAYLPLKDVDFNQPYPSIYTDLVAGVAVESSSNFVFENNKLYVNVSRNSTGFPTLDAFIIANSENAYIGNNTIVEIDNKTLPGNNNYLYAVDVYACDGAVIEDNKITLHSEGGSIIPGTNNGTGAAYGIQLTGPHTVTISNNIINTANNGPNCGIYSQNFNGDSFLTIVDNTIYVEGNASSSHSWSLVTGMELQDNEAYVAGNIITVYNKETYTDGDNVYGISFSQYGNAVPTFEITNNTVEVINGKYAVYVQYSQDSVVYENCLYTDYYCGDAAVFDPGDIWIYGNYCPNCNCVNCNCTH